MKKNVVSEKVRRALLQLGLTEKEVFVWLALLEKGALSALDVSRQTGINRVTVYSALEILKRKGMVAESKKGKRDLFVAEDPESLRELLDEKKRKIKKEDTLLNQLILPSLRAVNVNQEDKPKILFYEGLDGIYKIYNEYTLKSRYLIGCGSYDSVMKVSSYKVETLYLKEIKRRKILYKAVLEDTPTNRKFAELGRGYFHPKFLPKGEKITADIHSFGPYVALMSYEKMVSTVIEDESIAQSIRLYLEFMWERL